MNKRLFWTIAALLTTVLGTPLASHAQQNKPVNPSRVNRQATSPHLPPAQPVDVVKVGEYQSSAGTKANDRVIARIQPHEVTGRQAATLYVRNIPVLTFLGSQPVSSGGTKVGVVKDDNDDNFPATAPVWRANLVAAKLNQLTQENVDADKITVISVPDRDSYTTAAATIDTITHSRTGDVSHSNENRYNWQAEGVLAQKRGERYLIKVNGEELVEINGETRLADTTNDLAKDALQATNRLRRLLGNAPPLREIAGRPMPLPKLPKEISLGPVRISLSGVASWYGPGSDGTESASGETFNENELTAAHRSLPFGTKVRVTNLENGRSVVVRINDRGPYIQGRIIDLSTAAARVLGLIQTGVAQVRVDVLGN